MTAITDALIGFSYIIFPAIRYLFVGDKQPAPMTIANP